MVRSSTLMQPRSQTLPSRCEGVETNLVCNRLTPHLRSLLLNAHQGIITEFVVEAHPIGKVWGGFRFYTSLEEEAIYAALHDFVPGGAEDPKAAIILTSLIALGSTESFAIFYFYDGPEPPTSGPFAKFLDIPALLDVTYAQSYSSLVGFPCRPLAALGK